MVQRITIAPQGPEFSRFVMGYWRLMDWNMSARQLVSFIEEHLDLGVTTVDPVSYTHLDVYKRQGLGYSFVPVMGAIVAGLALLLVFMSVRKQPETVCVANS